MRLSEMDVKYRAAMRQVRAPAEALVVVVVLCLSHIALLAVFVHACNSSCSTGVSAWLFAGTG